MIQVTGFQNSPACSWAQAGAQGQADCHALSSSCLLVSPSGVVSLFLPSGLPCSSSGMRSRCAEMLEGTWLGSYFWLRLSSEVLERMFLTPLAF